MGLIMLVLIGIVPGTYALSMGSSTADITSVVEAAKSSFESAAHGFEVRHPGLAREVLRPSLQPDAVLATLDPLPLVRQLTAALDGRTSCSDLGSEERWEVRTHLVELGAAICLGLGTMWADKSGIQAETVRDIALAWIITLPAVMILAGGLYWAATFVTG